MEKKKWFIVLLLGGIIMIVASVVGSIGIFKYLHMVIGYLAFNFVDYVTDSTRMWLDLFFYPLFDIATILAAGGGYTVIIGGILVLLNLYSIGKILTYFGVGISIITIIAYVAVEIILLMGIIDEPMMLSILSKVSGSYIFRNVITFTGVIFAAIGEKYMKKAIKDERSLKGIKRSEKARIEKLESGIMEEKEMDKYSNGLISTSVNNKCPNCGAIIKKQTAFCGNCGSKLI